MPRRWARPRGQHGNLCQCQECARLDLAFPGEGRQLVLPLIDSGLASSSFARGGVGHETPD